MSRHLHLCAAIAVASAAGSAWAMPRGGYDGTYDPASKTPPDGMTSWTVVQGHACSITPNAPAPGQALFVDDGLQIGSYLNIKTSLDTATHFGGDPAAAEYEFGIRVAVESAGMATLPNFQVGFRDEGGTGRCLCLAWYRTAEDEFLLALMEPSAAGPLVAVSYLDWLDRRMREYVVKKYRRPDTGTMVVQVLIDGEPQFREPVPYASLSLDENARQGFQFGTSSYTKGRYVVESIRFGPLAGVPPVAAVATTEALDGLGETSAPVAGPWRLIEPEGAPDGTLAESDGEVRITAGGTTRVASAPVSLKPNRMYRVAGTIATTGEVSRLLVEFEQFRGAYAVSVPPYQRHAVGIPAAGTETVFEFPVYLRMENDRAVIAVTAEGHGGSVRLQGLRVIGGGPYRPGLQMFPAEGAAHDSASIQAELGARPAVVAAGVVQRNGLAALEANGRIEAPFFHVGPMATSRVGGRWGGFGQAGVHLQMVHFSPASSPDFPLFWQGKGSYNYQSLQDILELVLARDKEARIILGIWLDPYKEWGEENRDEVCQNAAGLYAIGKSHFSGWAKEPGNLRLLPSIFSRKMSGDIVEMLAALDGWLAAHAVGRAVVGYYLWGFNDADFGHWVHPCTSAGEKDPDDYSPAALAAWRRWLRERYADDAARLRASWGREDLDFDRVVLPSPARRRLQGTADFPWLLAVQDREVVDFNRFYGETPSRFIEDIVGGLRERTDGNRFLVLHNGNAMHGWRGYTGFGRISRVPGLDCISATSDYGLRVPGYPGGCDSLPESLGLQGKLFFHEFDYRSHCAPTQFESFDFGVGRSRDATMHRTMLLREAMNMIARGHGIYCMDMGGNWYGDPAIFTGVKDVLGLYRQQLDLTGPLRADVAYFLGEDSINYLGDSEEASRFLMRATRRHRPEWDTAGVPYHLYLQRDITDPRLPRYKVYVFLLPQKIDPGERQAMEALKRDGNTLVFLHAPGICDAADPEAAIRAVTGIRTVRIPGNDTALAGIWLDGQQPLLQGLAGPFGDRPIAWRFTDRESCGLAFAIDDPDAIPLARYRDEPAVAAAVRDFGSWRSIYVAVPWLEARFLANIARTAGAWRAAEPHDAVFANQHFIGIHAMAAGTKILRPYRKSRVTDALTGEHIADAAEEFTVDLPFGQTRVFRTEALK